MSPRTPAIVLPTDADLQPLYDAASAYGIASAASFRRWSDVKEEVFKAEDHENHKRASDVAYADAEYKRLNAIQKDLHEKTRPVLDDLKAKFPGIDFPDPGPYLGICGSNDINRYRKAVRDHMRYFVEDQWKKANETEIDALRKGVFSLPKVRTFKAGVLVYDRGGIYRIDKITHGGKRIIGKSVMGGDRDEKVFRPGDTPMRISKAFAKTIVIFAQAREDFIANLGLREAA